MNYNRDQKFIPEIHSISDLLHNEKVRFMKKGPYAFIGIAIAIFFFCCVPTLIFPLYCMISLLHPMLLVLISISGTGSIVHLSFNLIMNHIYASRYSFFESIEFRKNHDHGKLMI